VNIGLSPMQSPRIEAASERQYELLIAVIPEATKVFLLIDLENVLTTDEKAELQQADLSSSEVAVGSSER
jgi:hypothetical protein